MDAIIRRTVAVIAAGIVLAGSAVTVARAQEVPPNAISALPIPAGQIEAAIDQLDGLAADQLARTGVPGMAIAVVHHDRVVYAKGFGVRRLGDPAPVTPDTVFQLASMSKPVGATVVSGAVGRGVVSWDDSVVRHLPGFRLKSNSTTRQVTIADLYSHRSGLPEYAGDDLEPLGWSQAQILRRLRYLPLSPFRATYAYTNYGLTAAALAVARAARTPWAELSKRTLYEPLGMGSTSSRFADYLRAPNRAAPHVLRDGRWTPNEPFDADRQSPAGGVSSSVNDIAQWMRMMLGNGVYEGRRIVSSDALMAMRTPHSVSTPPTTPASRPGLYGLGTIVGTDASGRVVLSHSGAFADGAATYVALVPSAELGIVVLTNGEPVGAPEALAQTFLNLALAGRSLADWSAVYGRAYEAIKAPTSRLAGKPRPANPRPARPARAYLGRYHSAYLGGARVVRRNGRLALVAGPARKVYPLRHWSGDTFTTGTGRLFGAVTFAGRGRGGRATAVTVESLDSAGMGTYRRRAGGPSLAG
jgi:CubicO group peptidase (beta-lactamase class C family)